MALPKTTLDRINADAKKAAIVTEYGEYDGGPSNSARMQLISRVDPIQKEFYTKGATAEATKAENIRLQLEAQDANVEILLQQRKELTEQAQVLVNALEKIRTWNDKQGRSAARQIMHIQNFALVILQQWNEGKKVQNPAITHEQAIDLLNPPEDKEPQGMPLPPKEPFD